MNVMPRGDGTGPPGGGGPGTGRGGGAGRGGGRGRMGGFAAGPGGNCVCPSCGHTVAHKLGASCTSIRCPKCGQAMTRAR